MNVSQTRTLTKYSYSNLKMNIKQRSNDVFFIIFTVQYAVLTIIMYIYDGWRRWQLEKNKPLWTDNRYFPSFTHLRFTFLYLGCTFTIFDSLFFSTTKTYQLFTHSIFWMILFVADWCISVMSAATFLIIKYQRKTNPKGKKIALIGIAMFIVNNILVIISSFNPDYYQYKYNLFFVIQLLIYLTISIFLEIIYFNIAIKFVFMDSSLVCGIYGFIEGFVRPLFRGIYCFVKYIIIIILIFITSIEYQTDSYHLKFYHYVLPLLLEIWFISGFFTSRKNRPRPTLCIEKTLWRPFIEIFWNLAVAQYNKRNKIPLTRTAEWRDIRELEKEMKEQEVREKEERKSKKARVSTIRKSSVGTSRSPSAKSQLQPPIKSQSQKIVKVADQEEEEEEEEQETTDNEMP